MKKLLLASLLLSILVIGGQGSVYAQDDGNWIRPSYFDRLNMSAQEVLNLVSRKLMPGATAYLALEVVSSAGNFKVALSTVVPNTISPEVSQNPTETNISVSSFVVTTVSTSTNRIQVLIANNDTSSKLFYRYSSASDVATKGSFIPAGSALIEDRYKGFIRLLAAPGSSPIDVRVIDYIK